MEKEEVQGPNIEVLHNKLFLFYYFYCLYAHTKVKRKPVINYSTEAVII